MLVGFWRSFVGKGATRMDQAPVARFGVDIPPELMEAITAGGVIAPRISRAEALQVPAVLRARNLIAGTLGSLPLTTIGPGKHEIEGTYLLGGNIDPDVPNSVTMAYTVEDLLFEGIAWWRITKWGWHQFPTEARWVPSTSVSVQPATALLPSQARVSPDQPWNLSGTVYIDGLPVPDREVIRFDSPNPPLLRHAARAIRTALKLDTAAASYSDDPLPLAVFTPKEGVDPGTAEDITAMLDEWDAARHRRATGYVGAALDYNPVGWSPEQLQLADARQHAVLEIARSAGIDPEDLGVSTTSRTYQNSEQRRQDLLDFTLGVYVSALQDRLSMRDVLPRGYKAKVKFDGFLRSDTKTRMETYAIGKTVGAYTDDEIRDLEDRPRLTAAEKASIAPKPVLSSNGDRPVSEEPMMKTQPAAVFAAYVVEHITFDAAEVSATFRVNIDKRTISGLVVLWGKIANNGQGRWKFAENSLYWVDVSRTKLNLYHDHTQAVAKAVRLQSTQAGLDASFQVARGAEGDRALSLAEDGVLDGFSVEIDFEEGDGWKPDPDDKSVRLVNRAKLRGVVLTAMSAFDDARVSAVAASLDQRKDTTMATEPVDPPAAPPPAQFDFDGFTKQLADELVDSHKKLTEDLTQSLGDSFSAGIKSALENMYDPQRDGPEPVRAARYQVTREAPIYSFDGGGPSLVRDAWYATREHDDDAKERLRRFHAQTNEVQKLVSSHVAFQAANADGQFTTVTTTVGAAVIPPGYRPDLFVPMLAQDRPLVNACSRGTIANATPFVVPTFGTMTNLTDPHTEGNAPSEGGITFGTKTVTPGAISGKLPLTREIVDSANPAIDMIALAAMREDYARQTEANVYTLLNGSNGVGGTITTDNVPSGAQASTIVAAATDDGAQALVKHIRERLAKYPFQRFNAPTMGFMGQNATTRLATANDDVGRPLLPSIAPQNTVGVGNAITQGWSVDSLSLVPAWAMTGVAAGDAQIIILNRADVWAWESPTLAFRFEEKSGPQIIELALFGYFATHALRPVGLSGIRITLT